MDSARKSRWKLTCYFTDEDGLANYIHAIMHDGEEEEENGY